MKGSFLRELFSGHVDLTAISPYPELGRGRAQQIEPLLAELRRARADEGGLNYLLGIDLLRRSAAFPLPVLCRVVQELAKSDAGAAISLISHHALGAKLIESFGNPAQQRLLTERSSTCFAFGLTEASPGSDVGQLQTYAEPLDVGHRLSGIKNWVTNALGATHFIILARTVEPRAGNKPRLSAFVVPRGSGVHVTQVKTSALPGAAVGEVRLDRVILGEDALLGPVGKGFRLVMAGLSEARLLLGAASTGAALRAFDDTVNRLNERRAFGRAVGAFPSVQDRVAGMLADALALEALVYLVAGLGGTAEARDPLDRALVRLSASRASARVLDGARELFGAAAYVGDPAPARRWSDMRALTLLDGSDLALESFIFLEGTRDIRRRLASLHDPFDTLGRLDSLSNLAVSEVKSRVRRVILRDVPGASTFQLEKRTREAGEAILGALRHYGADIVERQHLHRRFAGIMVELATWSALASRVETEVARHSETGAKRMIEAAEIWVGAAQARIEHQLAGLTKNDDQLRDRVAHRAFTDGAYPFDVL